MGHTAFSHSQDTLNLAIDDLVERLGSANFISTLDLCMGYWQIPLTEESKEVTAFRSPFGHFQFMALLFGLHGAPATFQKMMDRLLRGTESYAMAYLDDVVVYSSSWEDHLSHLMEVLRRIKEAGLTIPQMSVSWPSRSPNTLDMCWVRE